MPLRSSRLPPESDAQSDRTTPLDHITELASMVMSDAEASAIADKSPQSTADSDAVDPKTPSPDESIKQDDRKAEEKEKSPVSQPSQPSSTGNSRSFYNANPENHVRRRWRNWLIPRSVLGITSLILAFSIGASLSGVALYSYYEYRLTNSEKTVDNYVRGFDQRFNTATETIKAETENAQATVQKELEPLRRFQAEGGTLAALAEKVGKSVYFVQTLDEKGAPSVGSAFVVESNDKESLLVTSYSTIKAATHSPGPEITVTKGEDKYKARLDNWVEDKDLAAITIPKGKLQPLEFAPEAKRPHMGERTFAASGFGATGTSISQGFVSDVSQDAIQHDAGVGVSFQGGPLINSDGQVTGIASVTYAPYGFQSPSGVTFATPIRSACDKLLRCPKDNNSVEGVGAR